MWGAVLGAVGGALVNNLFSSNKSSNSSKPKRMSYEDAYSQAQDVLTPQYEKNREKTLGQVDNNLINRGFYGQAPGDSLKAGVMTDMENDFQGQLANYATNLQNQQYDQDYQTYQLGLQEQQRDDDFWSGIGNIAGSFLGGSGGESLFNWLIS